MEGLDTDLGGAFPESSEGSLHNRGGRSEDSGATEGKRQLQPDDIRGDKTGGLRVWSPGQQRSQGVVLRPATVESPGSLSEMQISCPAPIYCLRNSGICVLTNC